ncbi:MAG: type III secretion system gatekeeper subunit SctW [Verrucomicrobia bacterium]|nr:type III secretion system gatekeeper subunit SctW [Verrucomicrobiota bacterium]
MPEDFSASPILPTNLDASKAHQAALQRAAAGMAIAQEESSENFQEWIDEGAFNPALMARRFESLELKAKKRGKEEETEKTEKKDEQVVEVQRLEEVSEQYSRKNPELQTRSLLLLRARISDSDSKEDILRKVLELYPDYSLADEALDFLLETTKGDLAEKVKQAKEELNAMHGREVRAGRNMGEQAREFSKQGLGSPTALRDLYRDITGNPRDPQTMFAELSNKFNFDRMRTVIDFVLHSLGNDLKSRGPSIDRGELHRLMSQGRSMQAILGVYRYFKSRMNLITNAFERQGLRLPLRITYELLAKLFVKFLQERYPSSDKVLQMAQHLGLLEELLGQVIIYTQMRDAVRHIAPRLFKSEQHRQDVLSTFIDTIEDLDDRIEEEEEKEDEGSGQGGGQENEQEKK